MQHAMPGTCPMLMLMEASVQERKLRKRVHTSISLEGAIDELLDADDAAAANFAHCDEADLFETTADDQDKVVQPDVALPAARELTAVAPNHMEMQHSVSAETRAALDVEVFDLLELADADLPVVWPRGWDLARARSAKRGAT